MTEINYPTTVGEYRRLQALHVAASIRRGAVYLDGDREDRIADQVLKDAANYEMYLEGRYPHTDGDVTVLGPGTYAAADGSLIYWQGQNYVPQSDPQTSDEGKPR